MRSSDLLRGCLVLTLFLGNTLQDGPSDEAKKCKKLIWFMAVGKHSNYIYKTFVVNALLSAKEHAPSLLPHLLYDGVPDAFTHWVEHEGGAKVVHHQLSFYPVFKYLSESGARSSAAYKTYAPYMRLDIPLVMQQLTIGDDVEPDYVLYTDVDVMLQRDIDSCSLKKPRIFSIGAEMEKGKKENTGVMYMNVRGFQKHLPRMLQLGYKKRFQYPSHDQGLMLEYFDVKRKVDLIPDEFNWKAYWGYSEQAVVLHWHGPKPSVCLNCFLDHKESYNVTCGPPSGPCPPLYIPVFNKATNSNTVDEYARYRNLWSTYLSQGFFKDAELNIPRY